MMWEELEHVQVVISVLLLMLLELSAHLVTTVQIEATPIPCPVLAAHLISILVLRIAHHVLLGDIVLMNKRSWEYYVLKVLSVIEKDLSFQLVYVK